MGYEGLAPEQSWDSARGYGWVGGAPQSRDRVTLDDLRRDFVNDTVPRTLRVHVPAGSHDCYVLTGDVNDAWPTYITSAGTQLAHSDFMLGGTFAWLQFTVDGGSSGSDVDLEVSGTAGQHWHLVALVIPDPDSELPPAAITSAGTDDLVLAGQPHHVTVQVANTSATDPVEVTGRVAVPAGWTAQDATATLAPGGRDQLDITVVAGPEPVIATLTASVDVGGHQAGDGVDLQVIAVPTGPSLAAALDAGTPSSPLLDGYQRLSPEQTWDPGRGYGWVGTAPQSRDRELPDVLRRDFVNDTTARVLRLSVPSGTHRAHALIGDATQPSAPTSISAGGAVLAQSPALGNGEFTWLEFALEGGEVDLRLSSDSGENWHLAALLLE